MRNRRSNGALRPPAQPGHLARNILGHELVKGFTPVRLRSAQTWQCFFLLGCGLIRKELHCPAELWSTASTLGSVTHEFSCLGLRQYPGRHLQPVNAARTIRIGSHPSERANSQNLALHAPVHLHLSAAVFTGFNVKPELSRSRFTRRRTLLKSQRQRHKCVNFCVVEVFFQRSCQTSFSLYYEFQNHYPFGPPSASLDDAGSLASSCSRTNRVSRSIALSTPLAVRPTVGRAAMPFALIP